jgi:hypothetical protein
VPVDCGNRRTNRQLAVRLPEPGQRVAPGIRTILVVVAVVARPQKPYALVQRDGGMVVGTHFQTQDVAAALAGSIDGGIEQGPPDTPTTRSGIGGERIKNSTALPSNCRCALAISTKAVSLTK